MLRIIAAYLILGFSLWGQDRRYLDDWEFLVTTVKRDYAGFKHYKELDWEALTKHFAPRFEKCKSDRDHVVNVMELLATLKDAHTGVLSSKVEAAQLPSKFDGLFGAGLCIGFDAGKWILRGLMPGHVVANEVPPGSMLLEVGGLPAWFAMGREERRVARFQGLSSDRSFWASVCNRALPFGDARTIKAKFLRPDGKTKEVDLARFGPGGQSFDFVGLYLPEGAKFQEGALSTILAVPWSKRLGFLKITGGQNDATVKSFHAAFDALKGIDALFLDCRGMGGGSDSCAWEMNGRLFPKGADNGRHGRIEPTGSWQFDGPVVMLQDEMQVSSAETFAWTLCETKRVVCVGRDTGGWGIIPKRFTLPSGLAEFRLGVNLRPTPITGAITEGVGWPTDVKIPLGPEMSSFSAQENDPAPDPTFELGSIVLRTLCAGVATDVARTAFRALAEGDLAAWTSFEKSATAKSKELAADKLGRRFANDLEAEIAQEISAITQTELPADYAGAARRAPRLLQRAKAMNLASKAVALEKLIKASKAEALAQEALLTLESAPNISAFDDPVARKSWLAKHGATKTAAWLKSSLWK